MMMDDVDEWRWMMMDDVDDGRWMMLDEVDEWRWMMTMNANSCVMYDKPPCWFACWGLSRCICLAGFVFETKRRHYCWCSWQMTSSKQMTVAAITRTEALTPREAITSKCLHTQELSPYRIRSLQDSASTSSTVWTMVTITIALAISAVACIANMERQWNIIWKGVASDAAQWSFSHLNSQASRCLLLLCTCIKVYHRLSALWMTPTRNHSETCKCC